MDEEGLAPILILCSKQKSGKILLQCLEALLSRPDFLVNVQEMNQWANALTMVCQYHGSDNLFSIIHLLLKHKIKVDTKNKNDETAVMALCRNDNQENIKNILRLLLKQTALRKLINTTCKENGWNALVYLCTSFKGKYLIDVAQFLLENEIQVDTELNKSDNALVAACRNHKQENLFDLVRLLLRGKIDVHWTNPKSGENALIALCSDSDNGSNLIPIMRRTCYLYFNTCDCFLIIIILFTVLLDAGIDVNAKTAGGVNCLSAFAAKQQIYADFVGITTFLIDNKIDLNAQETKEGKNILISLCDKFDKYTLQKVELLLSNGIMVNAVTKNGDNALLSLAKTRTLLSRDDLRNQDFTKIVKVLVQNGIDVNQKNSDGMNVLHILW